VNLLISFIFHTLIVLAMFYFAARQGLLGKQMKKIAVEMVKEKQPEKPKEPEKPKVEPPKVETPKVVEKPKLVEAKAAPPPSTAAPPTPWRRRRRICRRLNSRAARRSKPVPMRCKLYKGYLEYALRSKWNRPDNLADDNYVAEVDVAVNRAGDISDPIWRKGSGDPKWDESVRKVFAAVSRLDHPPPTNFRRA
jgi:hypothetical protein